MYLTVFLFVFFISGQTLQICRLNVLKPSLIIMQCVPKSHVLACIFDEQNSADPALSASSSGYS